MSAARTDVKELTMHLIPFAWLVAALALGAAPAQAQSAGQWLVKVGVNQIAPQVDSSALTAPSQPGTRVDVRAATSLILTGAYMLTDHVSVEAYGGLPYRHDIVGDGAIAGVGKIGSTRQISPTVALQYRFLAPDSAVRPYVGLGATYAYFYGEQGSGTLTALTQPGSGVATRLSVDAAWGLTTQAGATWRINDRWFVDTSVFKTWLKTTTSLSTGQTIQTRLDPLSLGVSVGYRY